MHGRGNSAKLYSNAGIAAMSDEQAVDALSAAQAAFMRSITADNPGRNGPYLKGWLRRSAEINAYAKSA